jgi:TnpA family transposase
LALPEGLPQEAIERLYTLGPEPLAAVRRHRGAPNRLGFAVQWAYLRYPGRPWEPGEVPPAAVLAHLAQQVGVTPGELTSYALSRDTTRREHLQDLLRLGEFQSFDRRVQRELTGWLGPLAQATDRGLKLIEALVEEMRAHRIVLPALSTLEALVWEVRRGARTEAERALVRALSAEEITALESLLLPDPERSPHQAVITWVRGISGKPSPATLLRFLDRLRYLQGLGVADELRQRVHPHRLRTLAREGGRYSPLHLSRLRSARRLAILAAFVVETIADYTDQALLLHDRMIGQLLRRAEQRHEEAFYRSGRAINHKLRTFTRVARAVLAARKAGKDLADAIEEVIGWDAFEANVAEAEALTRPESFDGLDQAEHHYASIRRYAPALLNVIEFGGTPACEPLLQALGILRRLYAGTIRKVPPDAPTGFVRERWQGYVFTDQGLDRKYYELCVLTELRACLRSGDIAVANSRGYRDFEAYLLPREMAPAAAAALPAEPTADEYLTRRREALAEAFGRVGALLAAGELEGVRLEQSRLVITPLASATPPETDDQTKRVCDLLPSVRITDLLVEVDRWTGFTQQLTALRQGTPARDKEALMAAILAEATNLGPVKMALATPGMSYGRLAATADEHLREETYEAALAELVNAQHRQELAVLWGEGTTSSSDGQRFAVGGRREPSSQVNARYGSGPSVLFYTHISDRYAPFHTKVINAGARDATHVLDGLLEHEADLTIEEHYTDTTGYTEQVFGLCHLLGFRFAPRMRDLSDKKLYILALCPPGTPLAPLLGGRIQEKQILANWAEVRRLAASIQHGTVSASTMLSKLAAYPRQNRLAWALREIGRIERTLFTLDWLESPALRRRVNNGLNKGEERNALARAVFFYRRGMVQEPRPEAMGNRACGLNLAIAAITLWNTVYLQKVVQRLADQHAPIPAHCLPHLTPLVWDHIMLAGEYRWRLTE